MWIHFLAHTSSALPPHGALVSLTDPAYGGARTAWVKVPEGTGPWPVVIGLHGGKNRSGRAMGVRFKRAEAKDVLYVYPNGLNAPPKHVAWTGPGHVEETGGDPQRDVRYIVALIEALAERYPVDTDRVYAAGFSNGGYMAHLLRCSAPERFAGFAIVSKALPLPIDAMCQPDPARPTILMVGTDDAGARDSHVMPMPQTLERMRTTQGCSEASTKMELADTGDDTVVTRHTWTECTAPFVYYEVGGGQHAWPGHGSGPGISQDLQATSEILRFFGLVGRAK